MSTIYIEDQICEVAVDIFSDYAILKIGLGFPKLIAHFGHTRGEEDDTVL